MFLRGEVDTSNGDRITQPIKLQEPVQIRARAYNPSNKEWSARRLHRRGCRGHRRQREGALRRLRPQSRRLDAVRGGQHAGGLPLWRKRAADVDGSREVE